MFDEPLSGQIDLYARETFFISYFEKRVGADVVLGKYFSEYLSGSMSLLREQLTVTNEDPNNSLFLGGGGDLDDHPGRSVTDLGPAATRHHENQRGRARVGTGHP